MSDIAPELWEEIKRQFLQDVENDEKIGNIIAKMAEKMATHVDSQEYAIQVGEHASDALKCVLSSDVLPDGKMYYNIAERTVRPQMELVREMVLETAGKIQEALNQEASLGMKAITPPANDDRIEGIINRLCSEENYDKIKWILDAPIKAYSQSVIDDFIHANADAQYKAGLHPKIIRILRGKGCEKCRELAGTYDYPDGLPEENVFMRHDNCRCLVTYDPGDGRRQNVHTKKWYEDQSAAADDKNSYLGNIKRRGEPTVKDLINRMMIYGKNPDNGGVVIEKILNHEISMKLSNQEYLKHVEGTKKFEEYADTRNKKGKGFQSRLTVSGDEAQKIIYQYAGTGTLSENHNGVVEYITLNKSAGDYYSSAGTWIPTSRVMIIYRKNSAHIVPVKEI